MYFWCGVAYMYFWRRVACEYFSAYGTSCVIHVVGFGGGPKFEANVCRLNPSATGQSGYMSIISLEYVQK